MLAWGIVEREIGGGVFAGLTYHLEHLQAAGTNEVAPVAGRGFIWSSLLPATLKHSLPDSSAIAQFAAKVWNRARFAVFGQLTPEVAVATRPIAGGPMLFYAPAVHALKWTPAQRRVFQVADVLGQLDQVCRERGMRLAIVLIPDKEQVYKNYLPASLNSDESPIPESCLVELEGDLRERGIPVVNLLPAFAERAARGELLYWRDDTHWNTEAIRLAAQEAAGIIGPVLSGTAVEPTR